MAVYLKKGMLSVAKSVNVTVDLSKLGKISTNRIAKFLLTGNIQGDKLAFNTWLEWNGISITGERIEWKPQ